MNAQSPHICPASRAGILDNKFRRWLQNPRKILSPYVKAGMTVMDMGCGPGFFTIEMAQMAGASGRVFAVDLQEGMLQKVRSKIQSTAFEKTILLHKCQEDTIGLEEKFDFILAFYMVHEVPDKGKFFKEIYSLLRPGGLIFILEPIFHVSNKAFEEETIKKAELAGLKVIERPKVVFSKTAVMRKD